MRGLEIKQSILVLKNREFREGLPENELKKKSTTGKLFCVFNHMGKSIKLLQNVFRKTGKS